MARKVLHRSGMRALIDNKHLARERRSDRAFILAHLGRVIDHLFVVLYVLLLARFALAFFGAHSSGGVMTIRELTDVFYAPLTRIFAASTLDNPRFVWPLIAAVLGYMMLHALIRGLLHLLARVPVGRT